MTTKKRQRAARKCEAACSEPVKCVGVSGGASSRCPGLTVAVAQAYRAIASNKGVTGQEPA